MRTDSRAKSALPRTVQELRRKRGLTLEDLSVLSGLDVGTISRVERGIVTPRPRTILRLARALKVSPKRIQQLVAVDRGTDPEAA